MTPKDLLIQELDNVSDPLITEVLDFLCFLKTKYPQGQRLLATTPAPTPDLDTALASGQQPYRYDDPFAPAIPLEDWDALQ
ncbi:MAG: hypothetical protein ACHWZW_14365 [Spirulina sp.]